MHVPKGQELESEFFYKEIKSQYQYTHVMGNCEMNIEPLSRLVYDKPYDFDLGFFGRRDEWDANRARHIADLVWAIDIQLKALAKWAIEIVGAKPINVDGILAHRTDFGPEDWRDLLAARRKVMRWLKKNRYSK